MSTLIFITWLSSIVLIDDISNISLMTKHCGLLFSLFVMGYPGSKDAPSSHVVAIGTGALWHHIGLVGASIRGVLQLVDSKADRIRSTLLDQRELYLESKPSMAQMEKSRSRQTPRKPSKALGCLLNA